ncbi:hypothetical protein R5R35_001668 [Gryllus longicercus]|uniref:SCD domain-containing protein n=2 Tax=Gryllus longicercus TaxID=2509291 RepID=A0AAN9VP22_9ORTH
MQRMNKKDRDSSAKRKRGLLEALSSQSSIEAMVDDWISKYKENQKSGFLDLAQLLSDAAGHNKHISTEMIEEQNVKQTIDSLASSISGDVNPPVMNKRVKVNIAVFFQRLIQKCNSLLFDNYLLDMFFSFLVPMSLHSMRAFRFVGTLVGLKIMTALVNVLKVTSDHCEIAQQQLATEQSKDINSQSSDRVELLQDQITELSRNREELNAWLHDYSLKIIFKERILDKMPEIQILCLSEVATWMQICPNIFMIDKYLLYYKLLMACPSANVRETILKSFLLLYETRSVNDNLQTFTTKHISSFVAMTLDASINVSVVALNLLTEIMKTIGPRVLDEYRDHIFLLVFSKHKQVATGAGTFLLTYLDAQMEEKPSHFNILINLVEFFEEAHLPLHAPFMVEALLHKCPALTDWEVMCSVLIRDCGDMTLEQENCFLKIMTAAMNQACNGISPRTKDAKPIMTAKMVKMRDIHKLKITEYFTEHLPRLLHKYRENSDKVVMFLQIIKHLRFERIIPTKQGIFNSFSKSIENLIEIHSDEQVLRGCCDVMEFINSELHSAAEFGDSMWDSVEGHIFGKFMQAVEQIQKCIQVNISPSDDQTFIICNTLEKLVIFCEYKDRKWEELWIVCLNFITHSRNHLEFPVNFITNCIKICHLKVLWDRKGLDSFSEEKLTESLGVPLQSKLQQLLYVLQQLMTHEIMELRETAYFVICDVLLIFCEDCMTSVKNLGIIADETLKPLLQNFVEKMVFQGDYVEVKKGFTLEFRRSVLTAYCKLVSYGMLDIKAGIWIFNYYEKKGKDYYDILKKTFVNMLESDAIECGRALMNMLISSFRFLLENEKRTLQSIKQMLGGHYGTFSQLLSTCPQAFLHFHQEGILFAFGKDADSKGNKIFLEILLEFVEALTPSQSTFLLELVKRLEGNSPEESSCSAGYRNSLFRKSKSVTPTKKRESSQPSIKQQSRSNSRPAKRFSTRNIEDNISKITFEAPSAAKRKTSVSNSSVKIKKNIGKYEC